MTKLNVSVSFRSPRFKPTPGELDEGSQEFINPGVFGRQLATFLADRLAGKGTKVRGVIQEDWGCWVEVENPDKYFLAVGVANHDDGQSLTGFKTETHRAIVEPDYSPIRRWFKKIDTEQRVTDLFSQVREILEAEADITDIEVGSL